jgi:phenylacetate-coenzyme A ligase PaaK-like adenylate-forming protein
VNIALLGAISKGHLLADLDPSQRSNFEMYALAAYARLNEERRPVLERIDGRVEDYVITPDGRRVGRMDHIFKDALEVKEAQIHQPSQGRIVVRFVPRAGFDETVRRRLEQEFRGRLGDEIEIGWERVDAIPRQPNGKFRAVVSDLDVAKLVRSR